MKAKKGAVIKLSLLIHQVDNNPNYASNLEVAKSFMTAHGTEDLAAQTEMLHDDLLWQPPAYGSEQYGKTEHIEALAMYQTVFDNILFTADNWLPGVLAETGELDGSVRTYGTWTGVSASTGIRTGNRENVVLASKIAGGGDYTKHIRTGGPHLKKKSLLNNLRKS